MISIHAAREGGDLRTVFRLEHGDISIHAAREGGDACRVWDTDGCTQFQSTPPVKAATPIWDIAFLTILDFNPRRP